MRKIGIGAAGLALALGGLFMAPQVASAATAQPASAYGCAGSQVGSWALAQTKGGPVWGHAYLYYSTANNGTNCAVYVAALHVGTNRYMGIWIRFHGANSFVEDEGNYAYYAGPVRLTNTNGRCLDVGYDDTDPTIDSGTGSGVDNVACG